jgi:hypothetical protein
MRWHQALIAALAAWTMVVLMAALAFGGDTPGCGRPPAPERRTVCQDDSEGPSCIFRRSYFTHDPETGQRVAQYQAEQTTYVREDPTYQESGFRHQEVYIRGADGSWDHEHVVKTWGDGENMRPYGEWEFPYRAGATPYGPWGNPQGPWTLPFDSWQNPYGLGRLPYQQPWPVGPNQPPYQQNAPYRGSYGPTPMPYNQPGPYGQQMPYGQPSSRNSNPATRYSPQGP